MECNEGVVVVLLATHVLSQSQQVHERELALLDRELADKFQPTPKFSKELLSLRHVYKKLCQLDRYVFIITAHTSIHSRFGARFEEAQVIHQKVIDLVCVCCAFVRVCACVLYMCVCLRRN